MHDRGVMKTYHHENALLGIDKEKQPKVLRCFSKYVKGRVEAAGLLPLMTCIFPSVDKTMLSAFSEIWKLETSSFHLPFGEMTITLDDVSSLLHIPVEGKFFTLPTLTCEEATIILVKQLGVTRDEVAEEIRRSLGPYARSSWLLKVVEEMAEKGLTKKAARAFLLRLVKMTIFCGKTNSKVEVSYLGLFLGLEKVGEFAWGAMELAYLYDQLKEATKLRTNSIGGYLNLFQAWIFEHCPTNLFDRNVCLYSGWIRHSGMIRPYVPERVMRQFQMLQDQPNLPPANIPPIEEIDNLEKEADDDDSGSGDAMHGGGGPDKKRKGKVAEVS
ncbi:protein MAINTENANCE OF MERISTEMS-like [Lotus japonicus]|uniref:protein MAINTENANCE OF MERISTEMS-like n=1 Tax=Lotus japonicus TaxID=34305 RepID=UPI00258508F9|nr:protein MAINTENANCE OF MERISTEMS-like [Lotus japonicus]